ncbi:MAG: hypothetical protein C0403_09480 [Desulfobacterium sp.]|nr:hypothetical protein [Desulfobacterium sp.]
MKSWIKNQRGHFIFFGIIIRMNPVAEKLGPSLTRDTVTNVKNAGFFVKTVFLYIWMRSRLFMRLRRIHNTIPT